MGKSTHCQTSHELTKDAIIMSFDLIHLALQEIIWWGGQMPPYATPHNYQSAILPSRGQASYSKTPLMLHSPLNSCHTPQAPAITLVNCLLCPSQFLQMPGIQNSYRQVSMVPELRLCRHGAALCIPLCLLVSRVSRRHCLV